MLKKLTFLGLVISTNCFADNSFIKDEMINLYPESIAVGKGQSIQMTAVSGVGNDVKNITYDLDWEAGPSNVFKISNNQANRGLLTRVGDGEGYVIVYDYVNPYVPFQYFMNQFSLGYGFTEAQLKNGGGQVAGVSNRYLSMEIEHLFDNGVWADINGEFLTSSMTNQISGTGSGASTFNQASSLGGINLKVGYAFPLVNRHLLLTPYGLGGRNYNTTASTVVANDNQNISQDFFYSLGVGAKLDYRINRQVDLYLDQLFAYNWDQSAPLNGIMPQNNIMLKTTGGVKYNFYKQLQLGVSMFYINYQPQASLPLDSNGYSVYSVCDCGTYGGQLSLGFTY